MDIHSLVMAFTKSGTITTTYYIWYQNTFQHCIYLCVYCNAFTHSQILFKRYLESTTYIITCNFCSVRFTCMLTVWCGNWLVWNTYFWKKLYSSPGQCVEHIKILLVSFLTLATNVGFFELVVSITLCYAI